MSVQEDAARTITVVTTVHEGTLTYLGEAYESLRTQELPPGWQVEWLVQDCCREVGQLPSAVANRASCARTPGVGAVIAKERVLNRALDARGEIVQILDADDVLTPGALRRVIETHDDPDVIWTAAPALDLVEIDGQWRAKPGPHGDPEKKGLYERGEFQRLWLDDVRRKYVPIMPMTLSIKADALRSLAAADGRLRLPRLRSGENTALLHAASNLWKGHYLSDVGLLWRLHDAQLTRTPDHVGPGEADKRWAISDGWVAEQVARLSAGASSPWANVGRAVDLPPAVEAQSTADPSALASRSTAKPLVLD